MAHTYFNLSTIARDQKNNEAAEDWLRKALQIFGEKGNAYGVIELGRTAQRACQFEYAEKLYREALQIAKKNGNDKPEANGYEHLGFLAWQRSDYEASKKWYEKALDIYAKRGDKDRAAETCTALGNLSLAKDVGKQRDIASAKKWFRKALEFDDDATRGDWLTLYARLSWYTFFSVFLK